MKDPQEDRFIHLVRLAWDLRYLGVATTVELPLTGEPRVVMPRAVGDLRVTALFQHGGWIFTWGRGRTQRVDAFSEDAVRRILKAAAR
ncbi:hypothetical protein OG884_00580 [Streptosporangium sp. NBC_01755]|uniref:hypothetical protein n=1 Tax=unclassified Streptosporangium TaxID=2632669 RepID=UPI002DDA7D5F|nr:MULTISPECIES: hypothetical protein [unclassified Streptosporangium]WSA28053.1 hypothetical protein OIE13_09385 [Streptosporangium sp. NBC_01810]WSD00474.1 hypothetical protein OG884_00580 [Streptosporangium sp. NBC_01755]